MTTTKEKAAEKVCRPKITTDKDGARRCKTCGAFAATSKTIMICQRTGRMPK